MSVYQRKGRPGWNYDLTVKRRGVVLLRERRGGFGTKRAAVEAEAEARAKAMAAGPTPAAPARETFATLSTEVLVLHAAVENKRTEQASKKMIYRVHLLPAFGHLALEDIGPREIAAYKASKLQPHEGAALSPKTINNHLTVLLKSLKLAKQWGKLRVVPEVGFLRVTKPEIDFLTFDEAPRLLEGADEGTWRAMILVGLRAGLRQGELLALEWPDVDLVRGVMRVQRRIYAGHIDTPKGGRGREVPLGDELRAALRVLPSRFAGGLLFPADASGRHFRKNECRRPLWRACKRAGLRQIGWHVLRHTFASHLVMRGAPLKAVQELLGHASIEMTMRYAHLAPDVARDAVKLLDAPAPPARKEGSG